jgi:hypothetical protein
MVYDEKKVRLISTALSLLHKHRVQPCDFIRAAPTNHSPLFPIQKTLP